MHGRTEIGKMQMSKAQKTGDQKPCQEWGTKNFREGKTSRKLN